MRADWARGLTDKPLETRSAPHPSADRDMPAARLQNVGSLDLIAALVVFAAQQAVALLVERGLAVDAEEGSVT